MGADVQFYRVKAKKNELAEKANELREQARYDHGHSGYSGTIAEDNGRLKVADVEIADENEAYDKIDDYTEKWEHSVAFKIRDEEDTYVIGGIYSC